MDKVNIPDIQPIREHLDKLSEELIEISRQESIIRQAIHSHDVTLAAFQIGNLSYGAVFRAALFALREMEVDQNLWQNINAQTNSGLWGMRNQLENIILAIVRHEQSKP